jgi:hypothetical protein
MTLEAFDPMLGRTGRGLGQLPANIHVLTSATIPANARWMLAFVSGSKSPLVIVHGKSFRYQQAINSFTALGGGQTVYFAFTNNKGTYIFAYENVNGRHVIKICTTGCVVKSTPGNHAPWTVYPVTTQRGLGAAAKSTFTGSFAPQVPSPATPYPPQVGEPPGNGLWWWQFMWRYIGYGGYPATPPGSLTPPNQPTSSTGEVGKWVNMGGNYWDWFPPGIQGTPYGQIVGGDGVVYNVYASSGNAVSDVAASGGGTTHSTLAPPSGGPPPALPGYSGQWFNPHPDYWVFLPGSPPAAASASATGAIAPATTTATTSSTWLWWLLGIAAVGGVAYWVMD